MRSARREDYWRRIYERGYPIALDSLTFENILAIGSGDIPFIGGITAICGGNGVGKTTLLDAILASIDSGKTATPSISRMRLSGCTLTAHLTVDGQSVEKTSTFPQEESSDNDEAILEITWLDPASQSIKLITRFSEMTNRDELLEAYSPRELDRDELELLSYVVGKDYESCQIYEIEDYATEPTFPYFRAVSGGVQYGSETMGFGEMSLHLMFWQLKRMPARSILLIEEPETYVSPRSQAALMDMVAKITLENEIWVILTTHSPTVVSRIPIGHIRLLFREAGIVRLINAPSLAQLESIFGIIPRYSGMALVEDKVAGALLKAMFHNFAPDLIGKLEIVVVGSEANVSLGLKHFPRGGDWLKVIGIFDGDSRDRIGADAQYNWPYEFLPGTVPPEVILQSAIRGNSESLAANIGRSAADVALVLAQLEGLNHHDWFAELRKRLLVSEEQLMAASLSVWLAVAENHVAAERFVASVHEKLDGIQVAARQ